MFARRAVRIWDIAIYNRDHQLVVVVEVKAKLNASPEWAAQLRSNIFAHGIFPKAPYFLMAFPDKFYLWTATIEQSEKSEPTYTIDARPILDSYFEKAGVSANQITGRSLELIVASWLGKLIHAEQLPEFEQSQPWLIESGLYAAIAGGHFEREVRHEYLR
ncbi:MAG: hypothetical protein WBG73_23175 [Coleofasciculaceae cyanobacterium]